MCGLPFAPAGVISCDLIRPEVAAIIAVDEPNWTRTGWICRNDLARFRRKTVEELIRNERGELGALEQAVVESLARHETLSKNTASSYHETRSFGDRLADRLATFAGSWFFLTIFGLLLASWVLVNGWLIARNAFDPYPFVFLNLILSLIAAVQAPLIMMSQRRQEDRDRLRSENDYRVNLKAELEIRHLHEKLDHLLIKQWERLSEIQEVQVDLLEELTRDRRT
ncbi:DUF1003 domain-containing protein [Chthonobacter albigriseus]|uniref:DUF1003 domain-containing protein n=1 Tax=Chthonobacter albigriseus TaxID=1683161 RepID=UPI003CC7F899